MITRLVVYDFDQTIMDTPLPDRGREIWKEKTGEEYPHVGWWGREESLDMDVFDIQPYPSVVNSLKDDMTRNDTYTVVLTSRIEKLRPQVEGILRHHGIPYHELLLKRGNDGEKNDRVEALLRKLPSTIKEVNLFDDRDKEFRAFTKLQTDNPELTINIYKCDEGKIVLLNSSPSINEIIVDEIKKYVSENVLDKAKKISKEMKK